MCRLTTKFNRDIACMELHANNIYINYMQLCSVNHNVQNQDMRNQFIKLFVAINDYKFKTTTAIKQITNQQINSESFIVQNKHMLKLINKLINKSYSILISSGYTGYNSMQLIKKISTTKESVN